MLHHNGKKPLRMVVSDGDTGRIVPQRHNPIAQNLEYLKSGISALEIVAAEEYLIKSGFIDGEIDAPGRISIITVRGITNRGIDLVENAVKESKDEDLQKLMLDKDPIKIGDYLTTIFKYPVEESCEVVVSAILPLLQKAFSSGG